MKGDDVFENVLVGVDGRANGRDAIVLAQQLGDPGGRLTLAHVGGGGFDPAHVLGRGAAEKEREASQELLERERATAAVSAELVSVAAPSPGRGLHLQAERQRADLLVVGSSHRGSLGRVMLSDHARAALNGAPCAVAIASLGLAEHPTPIARVGVAYDGSPESEAALAAARTLAAPTRATLHALRVVPIMAYSYGGLASGAVQESIDFTLEQAESALAELPEVEGHAVYGLTGEELASFGDQLDVLVCGSRSYGPVRRLMLGSTSEYLERHARCSLLVLPRSAGSAQDDSDGGAVP
jgi:nucleotide-binding universal stress UspA family protein